MYYDDEQYSPNLNNDTDDYYNNKKNTSDLKKLDKGYFIMKRKLNKEWIDGKYYKTVIIEGYQSFDILRNAITGYSYYCKAGTKSEDLYFKVKYCTGELNNNNYNNKNGFLYYDSPEQFEKHQFILLKKEVKETWYNKNNVWINQNKEECA